MNAAMPALWSAIVTVVALVLYFMTGLNVGRMRSKHGIKAPAMTGNPEFERAVRVHMNTLEQIVVFLPLLWLATSYFALVGWLPAALGGLWIIGRYLYMTGYMADPEQRGRGFLIALIAQALLLILSVWGIVSSYLALSA